MNEPYRRLISGLGGDHLGSGQRRIEDRLLMLQCSYGIFWPL